MKSYHFFYLIIPVALLIGCTTEKKADLEGVWKYVSGQYTFPDTSMTLKANEDLKSFKFFGKTQYANITQDTTQHLFIVHAGTYRLVGDEYTEYFEIHKNPRSIGNSATFKYQIDGNQFKILSDNVNEVWEKIE